MTALPCGLVLQINFDLALDSKACLLTFNTAIRCSSACGTNFEWCLGARTDGCLSAMGTSTDVDFRNASKAIEIVSEERLTWFLQILFSYDAWDTVLSYLDKFVH